jgi:hypothetical protein
MRQLLASILTLGLTGMLLVSGRSVAQESQKPAPAPAPAQPVRNGRPADVAEQTIRREAEVQRRQREREFAKLRRLQQAQAAQPQVRIVPDEAIVIRRQAAVRARLVIDDGLVLIADVAEPEEKNQAEDDDEPDEREIQPAPARVRLPRRFIVASESFDQFIFTGDTVVERRRRLKGHLERKIFRVDPVYRQTPEQKNKLRLAGQGDIKHFFDEVEAKRQQFERIRTDLDKCREFFGELATLRRAYVTGPFDEGSLFAKILKSMRTSKKETLPEAP